MKLQTKIRRWLKTHKQLRQLDIRGEDGANEEQITQYIELIRAGDITSIGEIGMNTGLSTRAFLEAGPHIQVVSFDLMEYRYSQKAKHLIDEEYPGQHTIIKGDSAETVPEYRGQFDLVAIDGGHDYASVFYDIANMEEKAHENTILILDDIRPWRGFGEGPTNALKFYQDRDILTEGEIFESKTTVNVKGIDRPIRRWWIGKYLK